MMKVNQLLKYSLIPCLLLATHLTHAKDQDQKKKFIEKTYKVNTSTKLSIENRFGKVAVASSDAQEFYIKVEVIGKGRNEERAQRILDAIDINITETSSQIAFETRINNSKSKNEEGFEINYTVSMPDQNPLAIKNSFGDVTMGDRAGNLDLDVSYGSMKAGDVMGRSDIKLSFGSGSMNMLKDGEIVVKYSNLDIEGGNNLEITQGFSELEVGEIKELELESKYGSIEIEKVHKIDAEAHFSGFEIEELTGSLELECSYLGDFSIERLAKSFSLVEIDGKYGSYEIGLEPGLNANINAEFSYADLKIQSDVTTDFHYRVKESSKSTYRGKIGKGDDSKIIRVDSSYGNLRLKVD